MDAWLPEYLNDPHGTNLVLVRSSHIKQILEDARISEIISIKEISINQIIQSQIDTINMKRQFLGIRQYYLSFGRNLINKRIKPTMVVNPLQIFRQKLIVSMQTKSKIAFIKCNSEDTFNIKKFKEIFKKDIIYLNRLDKMIRVCRNPLGIIKKFGIKLEVKHE